MISITENLKEQPRIQLILIIFLGSFAIMRSLFQVFWLRNPFEIHRDSKLFYHIGYLITTGHVPYVHVWEVKPPLTYETAAVISILGQGNPVQTHIVGVIITGAVVIGISILLYQIITQLFNDGWAGVLCVGVWLSYPAVHYFPALGFRVKYFALFFGLMGVYFALINRPISSGIAAAFGAAYWQFAIIFCFLVLGIFAAGSHTPRDWEMWSSSWYQTLISVLTGFLIAFVFVVGPIALAGGFYAMISEVIISGLIAGENPNPIRRLGLGLLKLKSASPLVILGVASFVRLLKPDIRHGMWISVGGVLFAVQIFFLDFDGAPDLLGGYLFVALGVGALYAVSRERHKRVIKATVIICLLFSVIFIGGTGTIIRPVYEDRPSESDQAVLTKGVRVTGQIVGGESLTDPRRSGNAVDLREKLGLPTIDTIYRTNWDPTTCHYFLSNAEQKWVEQTDAEWGDKTCGANSLHDISRLIT